MTTSFNLYFSYALGQPQSVAAFRVQPEDFIVDEGLGFAPRGEGEHVILSITKTSQNTHWVAQQLAKFAKVKTMDVGYCGRKDRHAVTTQWFSLYLPKQSAIDWNQCQIPGTVINQIDRHHQKLRPGDHRSNKFTITLRHLIDSVELQQRLNAVQQGVPNYFGEQRFGRDGGNLQDGDKWADKSLHLNNRKQRGLIISALRAYLFNCVLSHRVSLQNWQQALDGEPGLEGEASGPLWGRGRPLAGSSVLDIEQQILAPYASWCTALEHCGLSQQRRQLVCRPQNFQFQFIDDESASECQALRLRFELESGQYATSVLREIAQLDNQSVFNQTLSIGLSREE